MHASAQVKEASYTRLCSTKKILTVNGQFPGPTIEAQYGETVYVNVYNQGKQNITIHWYVNCEWWKEDITKVLQRLRDTGGDPNISDAFTINGQPGDLYSCSKQGTVSQDESNPRVYSSGTNPRFDNTTTTAIVQYRGKYTSSSFPSLPSLPLYNDTNAAFSFLGSLKSLADKYHPIDVPLDIRNRILTTVSVNTFPCQHNETCAGPNRTRFAASMNNISFVTPSTALLQAYYQHTKGVYGDDFPDMPPFLFNFTDKFLPLDLQTPKRGTEVMVLEYNTTVEIVLQGTALVGGIDHPIHLHGYNFYIVGFGFGNFDIYKDPLKYNLKDPPLRNTVSVPINGWATVRFKADNPGVWFLHCHLDRHMTWGMKTVFLVKDGEQPHERLLPPPPDMPPC
ncbi:hypothetical protein V6N13_075592 [Hibiscus sabdariffa]